MESLRESGRESERQRPATRWRRLPGRVRRAILGRRRLLAALLTGVAVVAGLRASADPPPETVAVLVATTDLPSGAVLDSADLRWREFSPGTEPSGALREALGRVLAGPVRAGEPLTDASVLGARPDPAAGVATPIRITDADAASLLRAGDRIDLLATDLDSGQTLQVAFEVPVMAVPEDRQSTDGTPGRLVVVAVDPNSLAAVTSASAQDALGFSFSP